MEIFVVWVEDIERTKAFFEGFGMTFQTEQHGTGPEHYSCQSENALFEIYPKRSSERNAKFIEIDNAE